MKKKWLIWFCASVLVLVGAFALEHLFCSKNYELPIKQIERMLAQKEQKADSTLNWLMQNCAVTKPADWLKYCSNNDVVYFVTQQDKLLFWSSASLDVNPEQLIALKGTKEQYVHTDNAHCVVKSQTKNDSAFFAFIVLKTDYKLPESSSVQDAFSADFCIGNNVTFQTDQSADAQDVYGQKGRLFSLKNNGASWSNSTWTYVVILLYLLAFVLFIFLSYNLDWLLGRKFWSLRNYLSFTIGALLIVLAFLRLNWPSILFSHELFSPLYYASNSLCASLGHLLVISVLVLTCAAIFYFKVRLKLYRNASWKTLVLFFAGQLVVFALIVAIHCSIVSVVRNSSFDLAITRVENLSIYSISALIAIFIWGVSLTLVCDKLVLLFKYSLRTYQFYACELILFVLASCLAILHGDICLCLVFVGCLVIVLLITTFRLCTPRQWRYWQIACMAFVMCLLSVFDVLNAEDALKREKYAVLAEKLANDTDNNVDVYLSQILENVDCDIQIDSRLRNLLVDNRFTPDELTQYIEEKHFRKYWHDECNYSLKVFAVNANLPIAYRYDKSIADGSLRLCTEHFYANDMKNDSYRYLGIFDFRLWNGWKRMFVSLSKNGDGEQNTLSLISNNQSNLVISMAKYVGGNKVYNSGRYVYPMRFGELTLDNADKVYSNDCLHRIYRYENDVCVVVGERQPIREQAAYLFFIYFFVACLLLLAVIHLDILLLRNVHPSHALLTILKRVFTLSSILVLTVALVISVVFIYQQHSENLLQRQTDRVRSAQVQLESYVSTHSLDNAVELALTIQDMSKLYRSDVNLYDSDGTLMASSRPYLFSTGLFGKQMNPQIYFGNIAKAVCVKEKVGDLSYLASYAPIINSAGNVMAYVGMPQLFSSYQLSRRLYYYLALFLFVYLLLLLITTILGHYVGARILKPLSIIGQKMRGTKLGATNEKIVYLGDSADEIGLLVGEYNAMVEKLDESARLLALSERESAWRDMARQISHEIRNPLTPMKLTIQQLQRLKYANGEEFDERFKKYSQMFVEQIDSMAQMAANFSKFAQIPTANPANVDLNAKVQQAVDLFSHNNENVEVVYAPAQEQISAFVDAEHITLLLNNLMQNAIQAIPSNRTGRIEVSLTSDSRSAIITISDNGCGISDEAREKLFMPNFTTKSSGMGLGLYLVQNIVKLANGDISFETQIDKGTTFRVVLPLTQK